MDWLRTLGIAAACTTLAGAALAGCGYPTNVASGGACQRTVQCASGLVCSQGHCTNDLSMFGMGHPTVLDGGMTDANLVDAAYVDAFADDMNLPDTGVPNDAYTPPPDDAWVPGNDAYTPPNDAYVPPNDAYTPPDDAWVMPPDDAWVMPPDDTGVDAG